MTFWIWTLIIGTALGVPGGMLADRWLLRDAWRRLRKREAELRAAEEKGRRLERLGRRLAQRRAG